MNGNVPPPWLNAMRKSGTFSAVPLPIIDAMVSPVSVGKPMGFIRSPLMLPVTRGCRACTKIGTFRRSASWKKPRKRSSPNDLPRIFDPSSMPARPIVEDVLKLLRGEVRVLQGHGAEAEEPARRSLT